MDSETTPSSAISNCKVGPINQEKLGHRITVGSHLSYYKALRLRCVSFGSFRELGHLTHPSYWITFEVHSQKSIDHGYRSAVINIHLPALHYSSSQIIFTYLWMLLPLLLLPLPQVSSRSSPLRQIFRIVSLQWYEEHKDAPFSKLFKEKPECWTLCIHHLGNHRFDQPQIFPLVGGGGNAASSPVTTALHCRNTAAAKNSQARRFPLPSRNSNTAAFCSPLSNAPTQCSSKNCWRASTPYIAAIPNPHTTPWTTSPKTYILAMHSRYTWYQIIYLLRIWSYLCTITSFFYTVHWILIVWDTSKESPGYFSELYRLRMANDVFMYWDQNQGCNPIHISMEVPKLNSAEQVDMHRVIL